MQRRLKPGEDPFFYDIARDPAQAEPPPDEENKHVYVGPKTLPPIGDHKTIPNARVMVADPRKMPTLKRIDRASESAPAAAAEGDSVDAVVSPVAEAAAGAEASAPTVGPRGTAKMAPVTPNANEDAAPPSSRREPAASPWAKEAEETPLLARDLPSSHAPASGDQEAAAPEEKKRSKAPLLLVFAAILLVAFIGVRLLNGARPTTNAAQPTASPNAIESPSPTHRATPIESLSSSPSIAATAPSASATAEEEAPGTEPQGPAPSASALVEAPRPKAPAAPKPSVEPSVATAQPTATTAPSGPKFVPPFQFPDEKKK
jgi:hypothetical protein